ncbi:sulfurtransferase TusA family protein [Virgibacillus sp. W0181]|uniref:sulfurtransferase TusA family protein n=1 Tax=Virgibacillus sp. W0181 TaxID=3391581 RepID=UPI003F482DDB
MSQIKVDEILDAKGLACPMPIVRTKKAVDTLEAGQVLEVRATDPGSEADIKAWSENAGHQFLGTLRKGEVFKHFLRKATTSETGEKTHPHVLTNDELEEKLKKDNKLTIIDVREAAEYAFSHIPSTLNIPFGSLEQYTNDFNKEDEIYLLCRTGNRSDFAARKLTELGFKNVYNVVPGMSGWTGKTESVNS